MPFGSIRCDLRLRTASMQARATSSEFRRGIRGGVIGIRVRFFCQYSVSTAAGPTRIAVIFVLLRSAFIASKELQFVLVVGGRLDPKQRLPNGLESS